MRINIRRGRRLTVILIGGPHEGVISSVEDDAQANLIWMLTDYGRIGSHFVKMAKNATSDKAAGSSGAAELRLVRYRVTELIESHAEIRLVCHCEGA